MKKEVFLAVSIGFVLGLIITFGIWTANQSLKQPAGTTPTPPTTTSVSGAPKATPPANKISLNITSPDDETLTNSTTVTLSGTTVPNAGVAVLFEGGETILTASGTGDFSFDIPLDTGYNRLTVTAFDQNGNSSTQNLTVTYTTQKI